MGKLVTNSDTVNATSKLITALDMAITSSEPAPIDGQFGFTAVLKTTDAEIKNTDFDMEFDIPFDDDMIANEAEFVIYNLHSGTANKFNVGNEISMTAGYNGDTGVIFSGYISKVKTVREGVDRVTTIYALDDVKYAAKMMNETTYAEGTTASYILKDLLGRLDLPIEVFDPKRDHTYDSEVKVDGSIVENIKEYSDVCGVSTYVYKQRIYSRPITDGDNLHFNISPDTGMIDSPEPFEESSDSEEYTDTIHGYKINMILQHRIATAGIVNVNSVNYQGEYRISKGTHSYDGLSATTEFECIERIETTKNEAKSSTGSNESTVSDNIVWEQKEIPNVKTYPKTYMSYRLYTDPTASGYQYLHGSNSWTNQVGLRMYNNTICCAFGSYYGVDGTFVKVEWTNPSDGSKVVIYCVKGDEKKDSETDSKHQYHPMEGGSGSVCEFIVDGQVITSQMQMYEVCQNQLGIEQQAYITGIWTTDTYPFVEGSGGNSVIDAAVQWAIDIANDDSYGYSMDGDKRWGNGYYDCSSFVINAYEKAGVPVYSQGGATYTGNMLSAFLNNGFSDVTSEVNLSTGAGTKRGDVLLNVEKHTALVQSDGGTTVEARGTAYGIVSDVAYRNYPWDYVLRYTG